jgi:hypothetical protein
LFAINAQPLIDATTVLIYVGSGVIPVILILDTIKDWIQQRNGRVGVA